MNNHGIQNGDGHEPEIRIEFEPCEQRLSQLGITLESFEEALARAIDKYHDTVEATGDEDDIVPIEDMPVEIGNRTFRVVELADVAISSDDLDLDDDDE